MTSSRLIPISLVEIWLVISIAIAVYNIGSSIKASVIKTIITISEKQVKVFS